MQVDGRMADKERRVRACAVTKPATPRLLRPTAPSLSADRWVWWISDRYGHQPAALPIQTHFNHSLPVKRSSVCFRLTAPLIWVIMSPQNLLLVQPGSRTEEPSFCYDPWLPQQANATYIPLFHSRPNDPILILSKKSDLLHFQMWN